MALKHSTIFLFSFAVFTLASSLNAYSQLAAPTASSDFAGCSHHTCTWVPWSTHKTFTNGDLSYTVEIRNQDDSGGELVLSRSGKLLLRTPLKDLSASVSVVWSEDNSQFAVTWSDGGAIGKFHVRVFRIGTDKAMELPSTNQAFSEFKQHHWCKSRGDNLQAYGWLAGTSKLVLIFSVYPTSDCGSQMGFTAGYVVESATGVIEQRWTEKQLYAYMQTHPEM